MGENTIINNVCYLNDGIIINNVFYGLRHINYDDTCPLCDIADECVCIEDKGLGRPCNIYDDCIGKVYFKKEREAQK